MGIPLFGSTLAFALAALPLVVLVVVALLGHMIGDWARGMLLAYGAVLLGFLGGAAASGSSAPVIQAAGIIGALAAVGALALGGSAGLLVLATAYGAMAASAFLKPAIGLPWPLLLAAGAACLLVGLYQRP